MNCAVPFRSVSRNSHAKRPSPPFLWQDNPAKKFVRVSGTNCARKCIQSRAMRSSDSGYMTAFATSLLCAQTVPSTPFRSTPFRVKQIKPGTKARVSRPKEQECAGPGTAPPRPSSLFPGAHIHYG